MSLVRELFSREKNWKLWECFAAHRLGPRWQQIAPRVLLPRIVIVICETIRQRLQIVVIEITSNTTDRTRNSSNYEYEWICWNDEISYCIQNDVISKLHEFRIQLVVYKVTSFRIQLVLIGVQALSKTNTCIPNSRLTKTTTRIWNWVSSTISGIHIHNYLFATTLAQSRPGIQQISI